MAGNETVLVDSQGNFTDTFRTNLPAYLGDEHKEFKGFENIKNVPGLVKAFADTKSSHGKLVKQMETALLPPAETAPEAEKLAFRAKVAELAGAPKEPKGYTFFRPGQDVQLPAGAAFDEEGETAMAALAHKHGVPAAFIKEASELLFNRQLTQMNTILQARETEDATAFQGWKKDKSDAAFSGMTGQAVNALIKFNAKNANLLKKIQDSGLAQDFTNREKWKTIGCSTADAMAWAEIGAELGLSTSVGGLPGAGGSNPDTAKAQQQKVIDDMYPNTPKEYKNVG